jgi:hypothetical protein
MRHLLINSLAEHDFQGVGIRWAQRLEAYHADHEAFSHAAGGGRSMSG